MTEERFAPRPEPNVILLVEDTPDEVALIQRAFRLTNLPYPLRVVGDGQAAMDYMAGVGAYADRARFPLPVLILLDLHMPGVDGFDFLAWRSKQPDLARVFVVVLSSSRTTPDIARAYDLGANSYLVKPVEPAMLQELVNNLLPPLKQSLSILLIDDDEDDLIFAARELRREFPNAQITQLSAHAEILEALDRGNFDVVVSDFNAPTWSGLGNLRAVKARYLDRPVIAFTGSARQEDLLEALRTGLDDYVLKSPPSNRARLPSAVRAALGRAWERRALRQSESRYRALVEQIPGITYQSALDEVGSSLYVSPQIETVLGFTSAEWLADPGLWAKQLHPDDRARVMAENARTFTTGAPFSSEYRLLAKDGRVVWLQDQAALLHDDSGKPLLLQGLMTDITARKQSEEALARSEERLRLALNAAHAGAWDWQIQTNRVTWAEETYLPPGLEPTGGGAAFERWLANVHPDDREAAKAAVPRAIEHEGALDIEFRVIYPDGTLHWINDRGEFILDADGQPLRMVGIRLDITARKTVEAQNLLRAKQMGIAGEIGRTLAETLNLNEIYERLYHAIVQLLPDSETLLISLFDEEEKVFRCAFAMREDQIFDITDLPPAPLGSPGVVAHSEVYHTRRPVILDNLPGASQYAEVRVEFGGTERVNRSGLYVPMLARDRFIGVLVTQSPTPNRYSETDASLVSLVANTAAVAVENARLFEETHRQLQELEAVNHISTALRAAQTLDEMLPRLLDETLAALHTEAGILFLYNAARDEIQKVVARGWLTRFPDTALPAQEGVMEFILTNGGAYTTREFAGDVRLSDALREFTPKGWGGAAVPIRTGDKIIGLLIVSVQLPREPGASETQLLTTLAEIAGNAIQRTRLHEQTVHQLERLFALHVIGRAISSNFDLRVIFDLLLSFATSQLKTDAAAVLRFNRDMNWFEYAAGNGFRGRGSERLLMSYGQDELRRAALEDKLVHIPNLAEEPLRHPERTAGEDFYTYFAAPLTTKGQIKGVLELFYRRPFTPDEGWIEFLKTLAGEAALAIDNAELFAQSQRLANDLIIAYDATIEGWSRALDLRDKETEGHTRRVTELTERLARAMGIGESELVQIRRGALLHDIGKMKVPNEILNKPGALNEYEYTLMKSHVPHGVDILEKSSGIPRPAIEVARCHHERYSGSGYSGGLKGDEIGMFGMIGGIVDCYDAISSDRAYHTGMSAHAALKKMYEWRHRDFHPGMVEQFIQCMGIYPIGSVVELNTGEIGVVVTMNRVRRLKPRVALVLQPDYLPVPGSTTVDLMDYKTRDGRPCEIDRVLEPGVHGINPVNYLPVANVAA